MFAGKISGIQLFMFERKNRVRMFQLSKHIIKNKSKPYKLFESGTHPYNGPTALITNRAPTNILENRTTHSNPLTVIVSEKNAAYIVIISYDSHLVIYDLL